MISFKSKYFVAGLEYGVPTLVILGVISIIYFTFFSQFFLIDKVECYQDFEPCQNQHLLVELEKLRGVNIFLLQPSKIISHLTTGDYLLRAGQLERKLPRELTLQLQTVYPVLAIKVAGTEQFATLDPSLRVIRFMNTDPNVPVIELDTPITLALTQPVTDEKLVKIIQNSRSIAESLVGTKVIRVEGDNLSLELNSGHQALMTSKRSITDQINALRSVLSDATITEGVAIIDVRFSQPVLRSQ